MAAPPGATPAPRPASAATGGASGGASAGTHSTQIFGGAQSGLKSTQLFGSGPHPNPALGTSTPVPNTTQAFGAVPPPPAIPPVGVTRTFGAVPALGASAPGSSTQVFGAVPPQGASAPGNATQTFGAVPPQGASAPGNATQTFGAVPPQGASAPGNATQTFGAVPPHGAAVPGNATQTFGAVSTAASGNATQSFGAVPGNATQTFGAVPPQGASIPGNATQTFGAVPPHGAAAPGNATQTFGAVPPHGAAVPGNATQTFGAVPASAPGNTTQTFGAVSASAPGGTARTSSGAFRGTASQPSSPAPAGGSTSPGNTTQTFGAVPPADAPAPIGRTQTFGAVPAQPGATPPSSSPVPWQDAPPSVVPPRASDAPGTSPQSPVIGRTALFGAAAASPGQDAGIRLPPEAPEPVGNDTLVPFGPSSRGQGNVEPVPGPVTSPRRAPVELPPELLAASRESSLDGELVVQAGPRRDRLLVMVAVAAGLVLTAVLAYPAWRDRNADMPAEAVEDKDRAAVLLRRDDSASRDQAVQRLRALTAAHPKYTEAQAELVVALSLRLSDLQADAERLRSRTNALQLQQKEAREDRDLAERRRRMEDLNKALEEVAREAAPLRTESDALRKELETQVAALGSAPEVEPAPALVARVKARAVHAGVSMAPDALGLAERLRNVEGASRTWSTLARAEYALSSGSPPESLAEISKELEALRQEDRTLLRAYVLGARVALRLNDPVSARSLLDDVQALNPNHQLAKKLLAQLDANAARP
ncbi:hypothetical protein [Pyxidicoccus xibeiensis]|uniref:hypothetical protein n=1 Tax=Pyxidicoccus xibeiensis TaxID=2906759 RepID=UPI0020A7353B|nr:hypothetical protein [Pyxidicoccus xibeiensis]MCP3141900.1 hypothetical protein [Pyxidicoccus xibeiensis]